MYDYGYDDGKLVFERVGGQYEINYRYDENGDLFTFTRTDYEDGSRVLLYAVNNTRGDLIELRTGSGVIYAKYTYDSWGNLISVTDANGNALPSNHAAHYNSIRYRGYVYDRETGLYYLQSRYYDAEVGRFLNADSVDYIGYSGEDISYNAFAYCENEPVCSKDFCGTSDDFYVKLIKILKSISDLLQKNEKYIKRINTIADFALKNSNYGSIMRSMDNLTHTDTFYREYSLYQLVTTAESRDFYSNEKYTILTYSAKVSDWKDIVEDVRKEITNRQLDNAVDSIKDILISVALKAIEVKATTIITTAKVITSKVLVSAIIAKILPYVALLSTVAGAVGLPVGLVLALSDKTLDTISENLPKQLNVYYTFNWYVLYAYDSIYEEKRGCVLEYYDTLAFIMGCLVL